MVASFTEKDVDSFSSDTVTKKLAELAGAMSSATDVDPQHVKLLMLCCTRVRVLCRSADDCKAADDAGAANAVVAAMKTVPENEKLQLAGLTAIVNLSSGPADNLRRQHVFESGALLVVIAAMGSFTGSREMQHMGCMALENICYGSDPPSLVRRREAVKAGGVGAVLKAMEQYKEIQGSKEVGVVTLQLMVERMPELREQAIAAGAKPEWLKEKGSGTSSSRTNRLFGTWGTSRKNDYVKK